MGEKQDDAKRSRTRCAVCGAFTSEGQIEVEIEEGLGKHRVSHIRHLHLPAAEREGPRGN